MTDSELVGLLKNNLELITDYMDDESKASKEAELLNYVQTARANIEIEGVELDDSSALDSWLIVNYAAYMYNRRKVLVQFQSYGDTSPSMPRMLRYALNNRLFAQKIKKGLRNE